MHEICSVLVLMIRSKINLCQYFTLLSKKINKSASWQIACLTCGLSVEVFERLTNTQHPEYCASLEDEQLGGQKGLCSSATCCVSVLGIRQDAASLNTPILRLPLYPLSFHSLDQ